MTNPQRDPIAAAVEGVCDRFERVLDRGDPAYWPCGGNCSHPQWRHWLRDAREKLVAAQGGNSVLVWITRDEAREFDRLREKLAETERERDEAYRAVSRWKQSGHRIAEDRDAARKELQEVVGTIDAAMSVPLRENTRLREALENLRIRAKNVTQSGVILLPSVILGIVTTALAPQTATTETSDA